MPRLGSSVRIASPAPVFPRGIKHLKRSPSGGRFAFSGRVATMSPPKAFWGWPRNALASTLNVCGPLPRGRCRHLLTIYFRHPTPESFHEAVQTTLASFDIWGEAKSGRLLEMKFRLRRARQGNGSDGLPIESKTGSGFFQCFPRCGNSHSRAWSDWHIVVATSRPCAEAIRCPAMGQ
ncbi:hypothetical protein MES4922_60117 [Mesorhizobium ventifaucium]|uniref:Uncharacterized protein n=1 Tax=Mesorhizobium ventifaucium TaxID=666020 RepID=A0ABN8KA73_9HYPH|nr:hypothetical protein MES4922_60117 [Mesorhizobium ventifaucium]